MGALTANVHLRTWPVNAGFHAPFTASCTKGKGSTYGHRACTERLPRAQVHAHGSPAACTHIPGPVVSAGRRKGVPDGPHRAAGDRKGGDKFDVKHMPFPQGSLRTWRMWATLPQGGGTPGHGRGT